MKPFINLGTRNKGTFWEYLSAYSFRHTKLPITKYEISSFLGYGAGEPNMHCHNKDVIEQTIKLMMAEFNQGKYNQKFFNILDAVYRLPYDDIKIKLKTSLPKNLLDIINLFETVFKAMAETHKPMLLALKSQYLNNFFREELKKVLSKSEKNRLVEYTTLLLTPTKLTFVQMEETKLFELHKEFETLYETKSKSLFKEFCRLPNIQKKLKTLARSYGWFHMEYSQLPWDVKEHEAHLWNRIEKSSEIKAPAIKITEAKLAQKEFFKRHPDSERLKKLTFALQEFSMILDFSKAIVIHESYLARPLFNEIARRLDISWNELLYLTMPEIVDLLKKDCKADKTLIALRKKHRLVLQRDGKIRVYQGPEALKLAEQLIDDQSDQEEIRGVIGCQGKYKGEVIIIRSIKDKAKFRKGAVLVTHDGSAEMTMFLKQAGAIVTEQGGMICHAAIVAREMKIPCIVGTKNATKLLKDGDLVEIDAFRGTVKKI